MSKHIQDMLDRQAFIDQNMQKKSPFDEGVMRAIKSAKQSIGMDQEQSDRAMRNGLMGFSEALQQDQAPMAKGGILGKLATRGMPAGMRAYDDTEATAQNQNSMLADMAHRFRSAEEAKMARMEQDAYNREMNDQKMALEQERLAEQRDYHNKSLEAKKATANIREPAANKDIRNVNLKNITNDRDKVISDIALIETLSDLESALTEAKKSGYIGSSYASAVRRKFAKYIGDTKDLDVAEAAKAAYLGRVKQGGGSNPSTFEFTEIMKTVPSVDKNPDAAIKILQKDRNNAIERLKRYNEYTNKLKESDYLADPSVDVTSYLSSSPNENVEEYITYIDPETGEEQDIFIEDEPIAKEKGLVKKK
jgi:hypothetical protein